ncbi:MAG TPA: AI-2E family transporter [Nitrospiria bacterium]|nr:AI-2E family transporter [Nitrospiria bacterium]
MSSPPRLNLPLWAGMVGAAGLAWLLYEIFRPLFAPVIWAMIITHLFWPVHRRLIRRIPRWPNFEAGLVSVIAVCILVLPGLVLSSLVVSDAVAVYRRLESEIQSGQATWLTALQSHPAVLWMLDWVRRQQSAPDRNLQATLLSNAREASLFLASQLSSILGNVVSFLLHTGVSLFTAFFLFRNGAGWLGWARQITPIKHEIQELVLGQVDQTVKAILYGNIIVAIAQGFLGGVGFWIAGIPSAVMWAAVMGFLSLIPIVGSFLVWLPAALILLLQGDAPHGIFLAVWGAVIVGLSDHLLRPLIIGSRTRLSTFMIFISLLGGVQAFGMLGIVLGPMVVVITLALLEAYEQSLKVELPTGS